MAPWTQEDDRVLLFAAIEEAGFSPSKGFWERVAPKLQEARSSEAIRNHWETLKKQGSQDAHPNTPAG